MPREESDKIGAAPQRPPGRPGGALPGDRTYTPRGRRISFNPMISGIAAYGADPRSKIVAYGAFVNGASKPPSAIIAPDTEFEIIVSYIIYNSATSFFDIPSKLWSACVTAVDDTGQLRVWNAASTSAFPSDHIERTDTLNRSPFPKKLIMPDRDVSFRIKLWGHDQATEPNDPPPIDNW